jgi:hypothetical protein
MKVALTDEKLFFGGALARDFLALQKKHKKP